MKYPLKYQIGDMVEINYWDDNEIGIIIAIYTTTDPDEEDSYLLYRFSDDRTRLYKENQLDYYVI